MAAKITYDQYVEFLCNRSNVTAAQLFADLEQHDRNIVPCDCGHDVCQGWIFAWSTPEEEIAKIRSNQ